MKPQRTWVLLVGLLLMAPAPASARKWTSSNGKFSIEAELLEAKDGNVRLKQKDGKIITVSVAKLGKADRNYLASIAKAKTKPEVAKASSDALDGEVGKLVNVEMTTDLYYRDVKLLEVVRDKKTDEWKVLKLGVTPSPFDMSAKKKTIRVLARQTHRVLADDGRPLFESRKAQQESQKRKEWRQRLAVNGIKPWPHLTRAEHEKVLADRRKYVKEVGETFKSLRLYETNHYLFSSNIPAAQVSPYIKALDALHVSMCKMYRIKQGTPVSNGKIIVFAFSRREGFVAFEQKFMKQTPRENLQGLCHYRVNGKVDRNVVVSCYLRPDKPGEFAHLLVHETSHGFNHCFQTPMPLHRWISEGIAEVVGELMVPAHREVEFREERAIRKLKKTPRVDANFFDPLYKIDTLPKYGLASSLTKYLIKTNPQSFVAFIEGMKERMTGEACLRQHYGATYDELLAAYGRSIGVPNLRK